SFPCSKVHHQRALNLPRDCRFKVTFTTRRIHRYCPASRTAVTGPEFAMWHGLKIENCHGNVDHVLVGKTDRPTGVFLIIISNLSRHVKERAAGGLSEIGVPGAIDMYELVATQKAKYAIPIEAEGAHAARNIVAAGRVRMLPPISDCFLEAPKHEDVGIEE